MQICDIFIGFFLLLGLYKGIKNGFFVEIASLVALTAGIFGAIKFSFLMKTALISHVSWNPKTIQLAAFFLTFVVVVVAVFLLAKVFTKIANFAFLGWANKLFGGVFGVLKMLVILSFFLLLFQKINYKNLLASQKTFDESLFFNPILKISAMVWPLMKNGFDHAKSY